MRKRLEEDSFLFQAYDLAAAHHWPLGVVRRMTLQEFYGWVAYHQIEQEGRARAWQSSRSYSPQSGEMP